MKPNEKAKPRFDAARRKSLGRLIRMLWQFYPVLVPLTGLCILFSAVVSSIPATFTQRIIAIIEVWVQSGDWASAKAEIMPVIGVLILIYVLSLASMFAYTQLMAYITQGFLCKMRRAMFDKMQDLPVRYFDTHRHGDIMSYYTNDIDTLRQLVSQAIPSLLQAGMIVLVGAVHHAVLFHLDDTCGAFGRGCHVLCDQKDRRRLRQILCQTAEGHGENRRICAGNDGRSEGGQGFLP